jgi:hypothetical protein
LAASRRLYVLSTRLIRHGIIVAWAFMLPALQGFSRRLHQPRHLPAQGRKANFDFVVAMYARRTNAP